MNRPGSGWNSPSPNTVGAKTTQQTAQETTQEKILPLLASEPSVTRRELADRIGLGRQYLPALFG